MQPIHVGSSETWSRTKEVLADLLVGNIPSKPGKLLRRLFYHAILKAMGQDVDIDCGCRFLGAHRIHLGDGVSISHNVSLFSLPTNQIVLRHKVSLSDNVILVSDGHQSKIILNDGVVIDRGVDFKAQGSCIDIGSGTYIGPYGCFAGPGRIRIGRDCMIASHAGIYANSHNFDDLTRPINVQGTTNQGIAIEDDCWLGAGVKVLDGVRIGRGSVIGAGAVVTKDIPPYSIAVGVPAKVVGTRSEVKPLDTLRGEDGSNLQQVSL